MKWQTITVVPAGPGFETTYNLFRRRLTPDLCCAVPEHCPVPAFLDGDAWAYAGTLREGDVPPLGFDRTAAEIGSQLNGLHLFQMASHLTARASSEQAHPIVMVQSRSGVFPDQIDQNHHPVSPVVVDLVRPRPQVDRQTRRILECEPRTASAN